MAEAKKGRGCFFYGCITMIVLTILVIAGIYFGVRFGIKFFRDNYTATNSVAVAPVSLPPAEGARVTQRVEDFKKSLQSGQASAPLELTGDELDYMFRNLPQNGLKDNVHLTITNERIHAQLSLPLDMYGPVWFGRYFNGEADVSVVLTNNGLGFQLRNPTVNGKPLPSQLLTSMNQAMQWKPEPGDTNAAAITNLDRVEIKDGKLLLHPKAK